MERKKTAKELVLIALKQKVRFLSSWEFLPTLLEIGEKAVGAGLDEAAYLLEKQGTLVKYKVGRVPFYGLPEWVGENGLPKEEYKNS